MALNFPDSPVAGTVFGAWRYDGVKWGAVSGVSGGGSAGDITAVLAGAGLSGGGTEGDVSIALAVPVTIARGGTNATDAATALTNLGGAPLSSPTFTGDPKAPTPAPADNGTSIATTAFVTAAIAADITPWSEITGKPTTFPPTLPIAQSGITNLTTDLAAAQNNVGRNLIHNPLFNIAQRGTGPFNTPALGALSLDRWHYAVTLDTISITQGSFNDTQRAAIGDEEANNAFIVAVVGNAGASAFTFVAQSIENVRRLGGKTVTVSFWAYATVGTPKIGVGFRQSFGTGGSPSGTVDVNATPITLSTTPTRYSVTVTLPSISGKTLGTSNDHVTGLRFWLSSGATNNTIAGGIGVQSATFVFWGVQLEIGSTMTPLEKPDPQQDLAKCQRFFWATQVYYTGYAAAGIGVNFTFLHPVTMRAAPTITQSANTDGNVNTPSAAAMGSVAAYVGGSVAAVGAFVLNRSYLFSADL